jgi:hypothetical protein
MSKPDALACLQASHGGIAPEPQAPVLSWHLNVGGAGVDVEQLTGECVLRLAAIGWRAEPRVRPCARLGDAGLPPGLPEHLVPAEERQIDTGGEAAWTFARWLADQYSSWPTDMNILWLSRSEPLAATSRPLV